MKVLAVIIAVLTLPLLRPAGESPQTLPRVVRVRLFSVAQPPAVRIAGSNGVVDDVRWDGQRFTVNGLPAPQPFHARGPRTVSVVGEPAVRVEEDVAVNVRDGKLFVVGTFDFERYVTAVVAGEASVFKSGEALKAMAVAARTYAAHFAGRHAEEGFDFCDSTHCQSFNGEAPAERIREAVARVAGELIRYEGVPIAAYYHRDCGGVTEAKAPYLPQVQDAFCASATAHRWTTELSRTEIQAVLQLPSVTTLTVTARSPSGRALRVRIEGTRPVTFEAETFRLAVGRTLGWNRIRSDLYDVRRSGERFIFDGRGAGHGLGLCQDGAAAMGEMGRSYREILAFYYPHTLVGATGAAATPVAAAENLTWKKLAGERAEMETTRSSQDQPLLATVERLMRGLETATGFRFEDRPLVRVYPSITAYRDNVGEPGWVAASTRGRVIRLQPAEILRDRGVLESTLRHELAHVLIDAHSTSHSVTATPLPRWFREGLVLWLTEPRGEPPAAPINLDALSRALEHPQSEAELRRSYQSAQGALERLVRMYGRESVLGWAEKGLPRELK